MHLRNEAKFWGSILKMTELQKCTSRVTGILEMHFLARVTKKIVSRRVVYEPRPGDDPAHRFVIHYGGYVHSVKTLAGLV